MAKRLEHLRGADTVVLALPRGGVAVGYEVASRLGSDADEVVIAHTPDPFNAVGAFYADFAQTTDEEVRRLLGVDAY